MKILSLFFLAVSTTVYGLSPDQQELRFRYDVACQQPTDIYQHVPTLRALAQECSSVVELGLRGMVSTWGLLQGLAENPSANRSYLGIDIGPPPLSTLSSAAYLAEKNGIVFTFCQSDDLTIIIPPTELLFIDTLHTYCQLTSELEKFSPKVTKYIAMHDTRAPWGYADDEGYRGNYSEYPRKFDCSKRGLWAAVEDFLGRHPEWTMHLHSSKNHGFTVLRRVEGEISTADLPEPYKNIELLPFDPHGSYRHGNLMEQMFNKYHPKVVIEVGCRLGQSTRHIATLLDEGGVLYAVDHWQGSGEPSLHPKLPYQQFLSNVIHAHLTDKIIPVSMESVPASEYLADVAPDLIYLDASHEYDAVYADLAAWYPLVKGRGILCGDNYGGDRPITRAIHQFADENGLIVHHVGAFWYYE